MVIRALGCLGSFVHAVVVNGCPYDDPEDPGNLQLDWLEVQLESFQERGMVAYVTGEQVSGAARASLMSNRRTCATLTGKLLP